MGVFYINCTTGTQSRKASHFLQINLPYLHWLKQATPLSYSSLPSQQSLKKIQKWKEALFYLRALQLSYNPCAYVKSTPVLECCSGILLGKSLYKTNAKVVRDRLQSSLLIICKSKQINKVLLPLKSSENHRFSGRIKVNQLA